MSEIRILTVRQPWAHAIIDIGKDVENRVRNLAGDWRGTIAIHAGLGWDAFAGPQIHRIAGDPAIPPFDTPETDTWDIRGHIIGVVDLVDVHAVDDCIKQQSDGDWLVCSTWAERQGYHLKLASPRPIKPVAYTGALGLRWLPAGVITECICYWLDPSTWDYYNGVAEPGSQMEPCYDCPVHFPTPPSASVVPEQENKP